MEDVSNMTEKWTQQDIPDQTGRIAIVTGANSGIGYETASALADKGAIVIMACRDDEKASAAQFRCQATNPAGDVIVMQLDLADLDSVRSFSEQFHAKYDRLDLLINNAGIMIPPYGKTVQGFESQFGVNHLGHFALTGLLLDLLLRTPDSRIVLVSSTAHRFGEIEFDDLQWESRSYRAGKAYGQSKLANLLFTYELQRRLEAAAANTQAMAAHPGWTATNLQQHSRLAQFGNRFLAQDPAMGALPTLYAATAPNAHGGGYYGPGGFMEFRGYPQETESNDRSHDQAVAAKLWDVSEKLTGVTFDL
jgi:NAD(P)-dependent dehydrogenase (short-subunit alcohol dehydrogenase family)